MPAEMFILNQGIKMRIFRDDQLIAEEPGLPNHEKSTHRAYIGFLPNCNVRTGDIVVNPSDNKYYVIDVDTAYFGGRPNQVKAFYLTEAEYVAKQKQAQGSVFNIENAYGSVIGSNNVATINYQTSISEIRQRVEDENAPDKEQMEKLLDLLQMIVDGVVPPQKGLLSKFSETMERHSWLSSAVASTFLTWLTQFPR